MSTPLVLRPRARRSLWLLATLCLAAAGCDDGVPSSRDGTSIAQETFIEVMTELRRAAIRSGTGAPTAAERERILAEHGVDAEDLRTFVHIHGENVPLMNEVWSEVERRLGEEEAVREP